MGALESKYDLIQALSSVKDATPANIEQILKEKGESSGPSQEVRIKEVGQSVFKLCQTDLKENHRRISDLGRNLGGKTEWKQVSEEHQKFLDHMKILQTFLTSPAARFLLSDPANDKDLFEELLSEEKEKVEQLQTLALVNEHVHTLSSDETFKKPWSALPEMIRHEILDAASTKPLRELLKTQEGLKTLDFYLRSALDWAPSIDKLPVSGGDKRQLMEKLAELYCKWVANNPPNVVDQFMKEVTRISQDNISIYLNALHRISSVRNFSINIATEAWGVLQKMLSDKDLQTKIHHDFISAEAPEALDFYLNNPDLYKHIATGNYSMWVMVGVSKLVKTMPPQHLSAFLQIWHKLSDEGRVMFDKILQGIEDPPIPFEQIPKLGPLFTWLLKEWSWVVEPEVLLDKAIALLHAQPELFSKLNQIPTEGMYLWNYILTSTDFVERIGEEEVRKVLTDKGESDSISKIFIDHSTSKPLLKLCEECLKANNVQKPFMAWLDRLLFIQGLKTDPRDTLKDKLEKLELPQRLFIEKLARCEHPQAVIHLLAIAEHTPTIEFLGQVLDALQRHFSQFSKNASELAKSFTDLAILMPHQLPRFILILKLHPEMLPKLSQLRSKLTEEEFETLLEYYFVGHDEVDSKDLSDVSSKIQEVLDNLELIPTIKTLLALGKKERLFLPALMYQIKFVDANLLSHLQKNPLFARQISRLEWKDPVNDLKKLSNLLTQNPRQVYQLFELASEYPTTFPLMFDDLSQMTKLLDLFQVDPYKQKEMVSRLLTLNERSETELLHDLMSLAPDEMPLLDRMLDMTRGSWIAEVKSLLALKKEKPQDPITRKMLALASSNNGPALRRLVQLQKAGPHPLLQLLAQEPPNDTALSPRFLSLLALEVTGDNVLLESALYAASKRPEEQSKFGTQLLKMVDARQFTMAHELVIHQSKDDPFRDKLLKVTSLPVRQQLRDVLMSLKKAEENGVISKKDHLLLDRVATYLAQEKSLNAQALNWIGRLQFLLAYNPDGLETVVNSKHLQAIAAKLVQGNRPQPLLEQVIKEFPLDIEPLLNKTLGYFAQEPDIKKRTTQLSIEISMMLVTSNGNINTAIISDIRNAIDSQLQEDSYEKNYLLRVLDTLQDPYFSERLEHLQAPPPKSRSNELVRTILKIPRTASQRDAQVVALSALLWPIRQGAIGSCFSTAGIIQACSSPDGLKQCFEDYMSLVGNGSIRRGKVDYPLFLDLKEFSTLFENEHLLARAYEYTAASLSASNQSMLSKVLDKFISKLSKPIQLFQQHHPHFTKADIENALRTNFTKSCRVSYVAYARHPDTSNFGAWKLVDRETDETLDTNMSVLNNFLTRVVSTLKETDVANDSKQRGADLPKLESSLKSYVSSPQFIGEFVGKSDKGLLRLKPAKYRHLIELNKSPLAEYEGGWVAVENYHSQQAFKTTFWPRRHPLENILEYVQGLSTAQKETARKNPSFLTTVLVPDHLMNLKTGQLLSVLEKQGLDAVVTKVSTTPGKVMKLELTDKRDKTILRHYIANLPPETRTAFLNLLEVNRKSKPPKTMGEFFKLVIDTSCQLSGSWDAQQKARNLLNSVIMNIPNLATQFPIYHVFDTNWTQAATIGYGAALDPFMEMTCSVTYENQLLDADWTPHGPSEWEIYEFPPIFDDFARQNYRA